MPLPLQEAVPSRGAVGDLTVQRWLTLKRRTREGGRSNSVTRAPAPHPHPGHREGDPLDGMATGLNTGPERISRILAQTLRAGAHGGADIEPRRPSAPMPWTATLADPLEERSERSRM